MSDASDYPQPEAKDWLHTLAKTATAAIPVAGGPAAELLAAIIVPPVTKRRDEWFAALGQGVAELAAKLEEFRPENLTENEAFVSSVLAATQIAMKTTQKEKRDALLGAVLNSASRNAPEEDDRQIFLQLIDELSGWHLRILRVLSAPREYCGQNGVRYEPAISSSRHALLTRCFPELKERGDFLSQIMIDLKARGLSGTADLMTMMSTTGAFEKATSRRGDEFLRFITEPTVG
jgi:hypothetical protein